VAGAAAFLLARLLPDIHGKPLFEDEAVAGLIGARPVPELIVTTLWDRGGSPLHFLLVHFAFVFDSSATALRWLSVVFALATLPLCYDLGRRLGGQVAGITTAIVVAGSGMLAVYGSFGRMYALFAFAAALAADLFVRALDLRTTRAAAAAAAAAWLLPAIHPYGGIVVGVEALVALALWRGRPLRAALPVVAIGLALVPFAVADLRLGSRFEVGSNSTKQLANWDEAWRQFSQAIRGFAGGESWTLLVFLGLAAVGIALVARRRPAFVAWGLIALVLPPLLSMLVHTGRAPSLSPRHLIFALPFWASFIGVAVSRIPARVLAVAVVAVLAGISPQGIEDPRSITYVATLGTEEALAAPTTWLRANVQPRDVLFPYSSVFLGALPATGEAIALPRAQPGPILDALDRAEFPTGNLYLAVPLGPAREDLSGFGNGLVPHPFGSWLIVEAPGPFVDKASLLLAAWRGLSIAHRGLRGPVPPPLRRYLNLNEYVICAAVSTLGSECGR
jgi:mannosyltransferase